MPQGTAVCEQLDPLRRGSAGDELHSELSHLVVGQDEAVAKVIETYQMLQSGLQPQGRPLSSFLLLGPTGTGKTRLVESLATLIHGSPAKMLKIDCAEFQHGHEIAKLIGSPPGYLGHRETHALLCQEAINNCFSDGNHVAFVLFDEIEKASDTLWNLLLGILDKATLTLGDNRRVDFSRTVIFMTSNLGAREIAKVGAPQLGFADGVAGAGEISRVGLAAAKQKFTPEFLNRIDHSVVFRPLTEENLRAILDLELDALHTRIMGAIIAGYIKTRFLLSLADSAKEQLISTGNDKTYGARFLKRTLERTVTQPLVNLLASGQIQDGDRVVVRWSGDAFTFSREAVS